MASRKPGSFEELVDQLVSEALDAARQRERGSALAEPPSDVKASNVISLRERKGRAARRAIKQRGR